MAFSPPTTQVRSSETLPLAFDWSARLQPGETISAAATTLVNLVTGAAYPSGLLGAPAVDGAVVTQIVRALAAGYQYRLLVTVTVATNKVWTEDVILEVTY